MKTMVSWFQIPCSDFKRAVKFYSTIFGIEMIRDKDPAGNDMAMFFPPNEGIAGAINTDPSLTPGSTGTRIFLNAEGKLDDVIGRVADAGGQIAMPRTEIPQWGSIAIILDSEGNTVGLHSTT